MGTGLVQGHAAGKWQSQNSNPSLSGSKTHPHFWPRHRENAIAPQASLSPVPKNWGSGWRVGAHTHVYSMTWSTREMMGGPSAAACS